MTAKRQPTEAERLRRHNEEMRFAIEHNVAVLEARHRLAQLKFAELEERVHPPLKPAIGLCGTASPSFDRGPDGLPTSSKDIHCQYWWQRD